MGPLFCPNCMDQVLREHRFCHRCGLNLKDRRVRLLNVGSVLWMSAALAPLIPAGLALFVATLFWVPYRFDEYAFNIWLILVCLAVANPLGVWWHLRRRGHR